MNGPRTSRRSGQSGEALIEFALVLPLLLILTLLVIDFGRGFFAKNLLAQAAREAARGLAVGESVGTLEPRILQLAAASTTTGIRDSLDTTYGANPVKVRARVYGDLKWISPGLLKLLIPATADSITLVGTCVMYREYTGP